MCGRVRLKRGKTVEEYAEALGINPELLLYQDDISPASQISFIRGNAPRTVEIATWWLDLHPHTLKPTRWTSFNSNHEKLNVKKSIAYKPYRSSRCIIPATGFVEGLGDKSTYHMIEHNRAIAFGGLYREYTNLETGEPAYGVSIITLGGVPEWKDIHPDSLPLMLDIENTGLIEKWLDPNFYDVQEFEPLLIPAIREPQTITRIDRPSKWNPIADSFVIAP